MSPKNHKGMMSPVSIQFVKIEEFYGKHQLNYKFFIILLSFSTS